MLQSSKVSLLSRIGGIWSKKHAELFCIALGCATYYNPDDPHCIVLGKPFILEQIKGVIPAELKIEISLEVVDRTQNSRAEAILESWAYD